MYSQPFKSYRTHKKRETHTDKLHQDNMSVCFIPPYTPLLYSKTGVYRGIHFFLIFALKHRLRVLIRTASLSTHDLCFKET